MVRWVVNLIFSAFCIWAIAGVLKTAQGMGLILMLPYILFELLQVVFLMTNKSPKDGAGSWMEVVIPVIGAAWPIAIGQVMHPKLAHGNPVLQQVCFYALVLLYLVELLTLLRIRYNFSIMPEARRVTTTGLYRYIRHPLYTSYFVWAALVTLLTLDVWYLLYGLLPMVIFYTIRARMEEAKLTKNLDGYAEYKTKTGMFFPKIG